MKKFLCKITVLMCVTQCVTTFESYGFLSKSDEDSDSTRSGSVSFLSSLLSHSLIGFVELKNNNTFG